MRAIALRQSPALPAWLKPLRFDDRLWQLVSAALTLIGIAAIAWQLAHFGYDRLIALLPSSPPYYLALGALYLTLPVSEWLIFHRLWSLPLAAITPFLRKAVINDIVVNYGGELYLYTWARDRTGAAMPFGAIKDVSILSAIAAHVLTLALMVAAIPLVGDIVPNWALLPAIGSAVILVLVPLIATIFARRVFSLSRRQLWFVAGVHCVRLVVSLLLGVLLCSLAMPEIPLVIWMLLQTLRLLVSRLPLIPNKELLFASALGFLAGHESAVAALMSMTAMALLALHIAVFVVLLAIELVAAILRVRHAD